MCFWGLFANVLGRVFLTGRAHVEFRKGLNLLFTHKALA
jgi:hypothetical protein